MRGSERGAGHGWIAAAMAALALCLGSCAGGAPPAQAGDPPATGNPDDLLIVDCLLPPKIKQLGGRVTYAEARKPARVTALDCQIRGGEYTASDRASYATSLAVWQPLAQSGDAKAQNYVGEINEKGLGVPPNYKAAADWYRRAAEQGYAPAQINLGELYERGLGVPRDPVEAQKWYRKASGLPERGVEFVPAAPPQGAQVKQLRSELAKSALEIEKLRSEVRKREDAAAAAAAAAQKTKESQEVRKESEQEISQLEQQIASLESKLQQQRNAQPAAVEVPGPSIQIIDPPVPLTRGLAVVKAPNKAQKRVVVGSVEAPAGLVVLTVNDVERKVEAKGIFKAQVDVPEDGLRVTVVAVDRQGKRAERSFMLERLAGRGRAPEPKPEKPPKVDWGRYHALVIGNDDYQTLPDLHTAVADARAIAQVLQQHYGFDVDLVLNANRYQILSALNNMRSKLTEEDNLLIYYAGHGELDEKNMRGHWLPVDAEATSSANWISNIAITDVLNTMNARHVLVIADSCYSGALTRSALARLDAGMTKAARDAWLRAMAHQRSRTALTSGGLEPVLDAGGGDHSIFARVVIEVLQSNDEVLEGQRLFQEVSARVTWAAQWSLFEQVPQYAPIKYAGHESGDFFFVPR
jgi:hypothetical protein